MQLSSHQESTASLSKGYTERHARCAPGPGDNEVGALVVAMVVLCVCRRDSCSFGVLVVHVNDSLWGCPGLILPGTTHVKGFVSIASSN